MYNKMKKSLIIKENVHTILKEYCDGKGLKINKVVENLIIKHIEDEKNNQNIPN